MTRIVTVVAQLTAKPGQEEELGKRLRSGIKPTLAEDGCITYDLHRSTDNPATWMFYEHWATQADLDRHTKSPHFLAFRASKDEVLAEEMRVEYFQPDISMNIYNT
ncbi:antibiotic biosynthesis monooxygenase [Gluconobacter sp. R71646]|uniref:Antibiotic biosynthesis monooxygenase n=4 Tax=Acetobacteraceae TaxID=433 RepID=A0A252EJ54_9PROT|nr:MULTISPECIES: putative quinol monooxygenase [Acetobacteraceae]ASL40933.1 antibiotic biosynthesis monooxygenase [Acetobacter oryzifermentans]ATJ91648.1 antibiotic biosynthesis monooxygenase [Acetobacter tropicalis]MBF0865379.1 antibiotic biosynthesis monooxygenase [Gluconobacter sp. R71656]MBF0868857.1 antibiotic biosynthesis monooxygenase [Gluconobacter sp. R75628]MBF0874868.1 antibiotic biosynthesis monooxygenase [Gluconobacter sp. R75629]